MGSVVPTCAHGELRAHPQDAVCIYSDGLSEAENAEAQKPFGADRVRWFLNAKSTQFSKPLWFLHLHSFSTNHRRPINE
jgi:hypothetical protein